jgi:hypothetical protein
MDPPCPVDGRAVYSDSAATGLGLLPMLGAGYIHTKPSRYSENVRRGLDYLISHQTVEGELFLEGGFNFRFYSHAIAAMALCEGYGLSKDPKLQVPAQRAINFIAKNQSPDGGWRYFPGDPGDTSVIGWQIFALRSAKLAGLEVPPRTIAGCRAYLDIAAVDPKKTLYAYLPGQLEKPTMTAEALLCRQYLGWTSDHTSLRQGPGTSTATSRCRTSGTSTTGITRPNSSTTSAARSGSPGTSTSATASSGCRSPTTAATGGAGRRSCPSPTSGAGGSAGTTRRPSRC